MSVACSSYRPVAAVEYLGQDHDAKMRDAIKRTAFKKAKVEYLEVPKGMPDRAQRAAIQCVLDAVIRRRIPQSGRVQDTRVSQASRTVH